ncbi:unnamed protein product [Peniophora sp. CBMAI 1063]|nr:unnamed protein product [Peniophora sp. CBMAI 1063]
MDTFVTLLASFFESAPRDGPAPPVPTTNSNHNNPSPNLFIFGPFLRAVRIRSHRARLYIPRASCSPPSIPATHHPHADDADRPHPYLI